MPFINSSEQPQAPCIIPYGINMTGDLNSEGVIEIGGIITGNVASMSKIDMTGTVNGNVAAKELYLEGAEVFGEVKAEDTIKIGKDTVIIGNVSAASIVVAGAVKGDVKSEGALILDATAIINGNIVCDNIQINPGATIEAGSIKCISNESTKDFFKDYVKPPKNMSKPTKQTIKADSTEEIPVKETKTRQPFAIPESEMEKLNSIDNTDTEGYPRSVDN